MTTPCTHSRAALGLADVRLDLLSLASRHDVPLDVLVLDTHLILSLDRVYATFTLVEASLTSAAWTHGPLLHSPFGAFAPQYAQERLRMLAAVLPMRAINQGDPGWDLLKDAVHAGYPVSTSHQDLHLKGEHYLYPVRVGAPGGHTYAGSVNVSDQGDQDESVTVGGLNLAQTARQNGSGQMHWPVQTSALDALQAHLGPDGLLERLDTGTLPGQVPTAWRQSFEQPEPSGALPF